MLQEQTSDDGTNPGGPVAGAVLGTLGNLEVRLAEGEREIAAAQRVRRAVFSGSSPSGGESDADRFDPWCDHLVVIDREAAASCGNCGIVATYRLLPQARSVQAGGFYSEGEFSIRPLLQANRDLSFLELGRSCVMPEYRTKRTMELLWHGTWSYVRRSGHDVMFGCASFPGTDPSVHAMALSFLYHHAPATDRWQVTAAPDCALPMDLMARDTIDLKSAIRALPPLIKGYLRLGAMFSTEAAVDHEFGTIDVLVVLPVLRLSPRYVSYFGEDATRHAD